MGLKVTEGERPATHRHNLVSIVSSSEEMQYANQIPSGPRGVLISKIMIINQLIMWPFLLITINRPWFFFLANLNSQLDAGFIFRSIYANWQFARGRRHVATVSDESDSFLAAFRLIQFGLIKSIVRDNQSTDCSLT